MSPFFGGQVKSLALVRSWMVDRSTFPGSARRRRAGWSCGGSHICRENHTHFIQSQVGRSPAQATGNLPRPRQARLLAERCLERTGFPSSVFVNFPSIFHSPLVSSWTNRENGNCGCKGISNFLRAGSLRSPCALFLERKGPQAAWAFTVLSAILLLNSLLFLPITVQWVSQSLL